MRMIVSVGSIFFLFWLAADLQAEEIRQEVPLTEVSVEVGADGFAEFSGEDIQFLTLSGEPSIPLQVGTILRWRMCFSEPFRQRTSENQDRRREAEHRILSLIQKLA